MKYRQLERRFNKLVASAEDILNSGGIGSHMDNVGRVTGGRKGDLSDKIAKVEDMRTEAAEILGRLWRGREVVDGLWKQGHISIACCEYITKAYFDGGMLRSKTDRRYITELAEGLHAANATFPVMDEAAAS